MDIYWIFWNKLCQKIMCLLANRKPMPPIIVILYYDNKKHNVLAIVVRWKSHHDWMSNSWRQLLRQNLPGTATGVAIKFVEIFHMLDNGTMTRFGCHSCCAIELLFINMVSWKSRNWNCNEKNHLFLWKLQDSGNQCLFFPLAVSVQKNNHLM